MDVNNVMNTYTMRSLWNNLNSNSSSTSSISMVGNVTSSVNEQYISENYFGKNSNTELQDIFQQVEPTYGIPLTYNQSGDLTIPMNTTLPTDGLTPSEENVVSLLQSGNTTGDTIEENILSQYTAIENGIYKTSLSSILSSNPYSTYSAIDSLSTGSAENTGNTLNVSA